jgi:hypothetical protein
MIEDLEARRNSVIRVEIVEMVDGEVCAAVKFAPSLQAFPLNSGEVRR